MKTKTCPVCEQTLTYDHFYKNSSTKLGLDSSCKRCTYKRKRGSKRDPLYYKRWAENNRDKIRKNINRRRKREKLLDKNWTEEDRKYILKKFGHKCINCGSKKNLVMDHFWPIWLGYGLSRKNAIPLCNRCNVLKGKSRPDWFFGEQRYAEICAILES